MLGRDLPVAQSAAVTGEGGAAGSGSGLQPVGELEQGLLAVDDVQVVDIGLQLLMLLWRHVASYMLEEKSTITLPRAVMPFLNTSNPHTKA